MESHCEIPKLQSIIASANESGNIESVKSSIVESFHLAVHCDELYHLSFQNLQEIAKEYYQKIQKQQIKDDNEEENIINTTIQFIDGIIQHYKQESILMLNTVMIPNPTLKSCITIIGSFITSKLCTVLKDLFHEESFETDVDWEFQTREKDKIINQLTEEINRYKIKKPDNFEPNILVAAAKGDLESIRYSVEVLNTPIDFKDPDFHRTPLYRAAAFGHLKLVEYLINKGANIEIKTKEHITPLYIAAQQDQFDVVQFLLSKNANIEATQKDGATPLYIASLNGHLNIVQLLVHNGANIEATENQGATPLHAASQKDHLQVVEFLVSQGANINSRDIFGYTPLYIAMDEGNDDIVEFLTQHGGIQ